MAWTEEDWLIIDSTLNRVAKSLRRIEQEEKKRKNSAERRAILDVTTSPPVASSQSETNEVLSENL